MRVTKGRTGCLCHNCDSCESEYTIASRNGQSFKVFWACGELDCEIAFCEDCARELFSQFAAALGTSLADTSHTGRRT